MNNAVFCYGTLQFSEVMEKVTGRRFPGIEAVLANFARYRIKNAVYPGVIAEDGATTEGILYFEVDADSLHRLDAFEGTPYVRTRLPVHTLNGEKVIAEVYIVAEHHRAVLTGKPWDKLEFARRHLRRYFERIKPV
jgi:gamma-glutamylcyclotransferase (GGCT)/AIG2-like uncharacterized protein YtfP